MVLSVLYASILVLAIEVITRYAMRTSLEYTLIYAVSTELSLLLGIEIDHLVLRKRSKIATFRRLAAISIITNSIWFLVTIVGALDYLATGSEGRLVALIILGAFFGIAFRALVFGSVFYHKTISGLPIAFVQPILILIPMVLSVKEASLNSLNVVSALLAGAIAIGALEVYLASINRTQNIGEFKPLHLLQAFLDAWALEDARALERFLEIVSRGRSVETTMIRLDSARDSQVTSALLIVPGVHPGPFFPIGSSNLPADIYSRLRSSSMIPLTVHSISDHGLNLSSKKQVEAYVSSLSYADILEQGNTVCSPVMRSMNKATVSGLAFGSTALLALTQAPHGMEDFPVEVKAAIEKEAEQLGFMNSFIIDTHNSEGSKSNAQECADIVDVAKEVLVELKKARQISFHVAFSHSSEINTKLGNDVGPAGIGLVLFELAEERFSIVIVDANNARLGFREKVLEEFEKRVGTRILEIYTSDTHVTAAKTLDAKGYLALGDNTSEDSLVSLLVSLHESARERLGIGRYATSHVTSHVKTIGGEVLDDFSGLLDATSSVAKNGAIALGALCVLLTAIVTAL